MNLDDFDSKLIALLGPTASGKSDLAIKLAQKTNSYILSLDSLSIYKEIDIASAKPSLQERCGILHFGIDEIFPNQPFSAVLFFDLYKKAKAQAKKQNKNLIIVGGSGFYLKAMIDGLSNEPKYKKETLQKTKEAIANIDKAYEFIKKEDPAFAKKITAKDRYRCEKWFKIFFETGLNASSYFKMHKKKPIIDKIDIFEIAIKREVLRQRIKKRTQDMIKSGLIDEVTYLEKKYSRSPNAFKAIGIKEVLDFLDGKLNKKEMEEKIATNTAKLAKRQQTFNKTQFTNIIRKPADELYEDMLYALK